MLTNNPKEYITLKTGPQKNFAEYYHRRLVIRLTWIKILLHFLLNRTNALSSCLSILYFSLKNPSKCPYNGARRDDCPLCHRELFPSSGGTYFSKVRFDVSRMSLIGTHALDFVIILFVKDNIVMFYSSISYLLTIILPQYRRWFYVCCHSWQTFTELWYGWRLLQQIPVSTGERRNSSFISLFFTENFKSRARPQRQPIESNIFDKNEEKQLLFRSSLKFKLSKIS